MWDPDGVLGDPRPTAWAYLACPFGYRHAEEQWRLRIAKLAAREGFAITSWWVDHENRTIDAMVMLHHMPGSGVRALFLPYPDAMDHRDLRALFLPYPDAMDHRDLYPHVSPADLRRHLGVQVFVLDPIMTICPESTPDLAERARRRSPLALLRRSGAT